MVLTSSSIPAQSNKFDSAVVLLFDVFSTIVFPFSWQMLTPKDLSFVGYTYKNFDAVKGLRSSSGMQFWAVGVLSVMFSGVVSIHIFLSCWTLGSIFHLPPTYCFTLPIWIYIVHIPWAEKWWQLYEYCKKLVGQSNDVRVLFSYLIHLKHEYYLRIFAFPLLDEKALYNSILGTNKYSLEVEICFYLFSYVYLSRVEGSFAALYLRW